METNSIPLIVDLDHTLIDTDLLFLSSLGVLGKSPWLIAHYFFWLWKGKGYLKDQLVRRFEINIPELPYNDNVISYIMKRKKEGSKIVLATASHKNYAFAVAKHLKIFDDVMASNKDFNLSSHNKADTLVERFGERKFITRVLVCCSLAFGSCNKQTPREPKLAFEGYVTESAK